MRKLFISVVAAMAVISCTSKNPLLTEWDTPYGIPPFEQIKPSDYIPAVKEGIKQHKAELEAIINNPEAPDFKNTIEAAALSGQLLERVTAVLFNLAETEGDSTFNAIREEAAKLVTAFSDEVYMNKKFFERIKAVYDAPQIHLNREQQMVLKKYYENFTRNGVNLTEDAQAKLKDINLQLTEAQQKFGNNLLAENNRFKEKFGIPVSSYEDEMTNCSDRERRKEMFLAYSNRANNNDEFDNKALCLNILKLKAQKAKLLGFENYAAYQLDNKMAKDPKTVDEFLDKVIAPAVSRAKEEVYDMQQVMNQDIKEGKLPKGSKIEPWDWFYYAEKVRKQKYDLDESLTRPYFKMENVRDGIFKTANKIYGILIEPVSNVPLYNPEVEVFKVMDADSSLLGIFMTDYFPRNTKRGGAWMTNFREQYVDKDGNDIRPIIINVGNMTPATDSLPALFTIDQVETVFHEFGHALHGLLTKCHYPIVSGTNVTRDFVETFSQFNENWAFQPEILALYAKHYKTGEIIPDSLVAKINNSSKFNQGFATTELAAASILDMKWHELDEDQLDGVDIKAFEDKVCKDMGLIDEIIPRYRTTYFNHIFNSGYSAGYYSYLWSEVLEKDAFDYFKKHGIYNREVADKFRKTLLEKGGSEEPMVLFEMFTGAQPNPDAMLKARGLIK
ncbi:MAG: M3 family metallopeptidase [Bacteroidales bacterium]|nr:M3 family metallopeptidase [Bacteroidales bacterium]